MLLGKLWESFEIGGCAAHARPKFSESKAKPSFSLAYSASASAFSIRYNTLTHNSGGLTAKISQIITHEKYESWDLDNDIALLQTATKLSLGQPNAQVAKLPAQGGDATSGSVTAAGWGFTEGSNTLSPSLQVVTIPVVSREECVKRYAAINAVVTENMM